MNIIVENHLGQKLTLSKNFQVVNVDGLTPSAATINTFGAGIADGTFYNSSYVNQRNIVLTIVPEGNAEKARLTLYRYFKPKYKVRLYFTTNTRDVYIDGYVETFEGSLYSQKQAFQISVICPQPFFNDINATIIDQSVVNDAFHFPFSTTEEGIVLSEIQYDGYVTVPNIGEESTGVVITLSAKDIVLEPTIYNTTTRETFTVEYEMEKGDIITIDTRRGVKTIVLEKDGIKTNVINNIAKGSKWFSLPTGDNVFTYKCVYGAENLRVLYALYPLYEGV